MKDSRNLRLMYNVFLYLFSIILNRSAVAESKSEILDKKGVLRIVAS